MGLPMDLQQGESVLTRVRRHGLFLYPVLIGVAAAVIILSLLLVLILNVIGIVIALPIVLVGLGYCYLRWYQHTYDEWIVTNQRIVDSVKKNWFHHQMSSADLINVQDMSVEKNGILPTVFNYGNLRCQTAGSQSHFVLQQIPDPNRILDLIDQARDTARKQASAAPQQ